MLQPFSAKQTPTTIMWVLVGDAQLHTHSNSDVADYFHLSRFGTTVVETIRWHRASSLHRHRLQHFKILVVQLVDLLWNQLGRRS